MRLNFSKKRDKDGIRVLEATLPRDGAGKVMRYGTRTGALLRVDGDVAGAFDAKHRAVNMPPTAAGASVRLEVERESLPISGLPSGPGIIWWWMNFRSHPQPARRAKLVAERYPRRRTTALAQEMIAHAHLDVAWLWTYEQTRRKALRTFATAVRQLERHASFIFTQSQPQLYEYVMQADPAFFDRVKNLAAERRFDCTTAALWVESDCNIPSGEALLRQMFFAHRFVGESFAQRPSIAWLPDSFGFANTLPTLLAHAGIAYFATTKLQWNDTTQFPYHQFVWRGPDGSEVLAALIASYEGDATRSRLAVARKRKEPLIVGFGDGGGGVSDATIARAPERMKWISPSGWFSQLEARRRHLPVHADELYLQYHRGVFTTHHRIKARSARLERALSEAEECAAWCVALGAPSDVQTAMRERLSNAWKIVLRNHFHDVITGTSIAAVYDDVHREYDQADALVRWVKNTTQMMHPNTVLPKATSESIAPTWGDGCFSFRNDLVSADVLPNGTIVQLSTAGGNNVMELGNVLSAYVDDPKQWDAWNIDAGYQQRKTRVKAGRATVISGSLEIPYTIGRSQLKMRVALRRAETFLRVQIDGTWLDAHRLLRVENTVQLRGTDATYGTPHGTVARCSRNNTQARRAQFEVPGQRFGLVREENVAAVALLTLDTYGWNASTMRSGRMHLGHSLLRAPRWPDPTADKGEQHLEYAFAPFGNVTTGAVESVWRTFAHEPSLRLFVPQDDGVMVAACKPASDGDGVVLRIRECDGGGGSAKIVCGAPLRSASAIDALERPAALSVRLQGQTIQSEIGPYALRSFRMRFQ